jgi:hypothetical protein
MHAALVELAGLARAAGIPVSPAEVIDGHRAIELVGVADPAAVRDALAATWIKRTADRPVFAELFARFVARDLPTPTAVPLAVLGDAAVRALWDRVVARAHELGPLGRLAVGADVPELPALLRAAGERADLGAMGSPLEAGMIGYRIAEDLGAGGVETELAAEIAVAGASPAESAVVRELVAGQLADVRRRIRRWVEDEFRLRNPGFLEELAARTLADRPLARLTAAEQRALDAEIDRLADKLLRRFRRPHRHRRRGRLDVPRTLRRALGTGGVPMAPAWRWRDRRPPRLVVLCDISDSVRAVSGFFLRLVHGLASRWQRVDSFVFVADVGATSDLFRRHDAGWAIARVLAGDVISPWASSDYGRALERFTARWLGTLTRRTTVIVLGDARSNYQPARPHLLAAIRRRAERVLWLNPEPRAAWGWGDSAMAAYQPACDRVLTVWNLASLRAAIDEVIA